MTENVKEILKKAIEAFDSGNVNECKEYCEQAFSLEPEDSNVKIMKVVSMLLSYTYSDSGNICVNVCNILETITDGNEIDDEIKNILIPSVFAYRNCWEKDNAFWKRYTRYKGDGDGFDKIMGIFIAMFTSDKKYINLFMNVVSKLPWLQSSPIFLKYVIENLNDYKTKNKSISFINNLIETNKGKDGELKALVEELEYSFRKFRRRRIIINCIKVIIIVFFVVILPNIV